MTTEFSELDLHPQLLQAVTELVHVGGNPFHI